MIRMFTGRTVLFHLFLLLLFFCPGCSSEPDTLFSEPIQACSLFTHDEIETFFGTKVDNPPRETHKVDEQNGSWMSMCNYFAPETNQSSGILIRPIAKGRSVDQVYDEYVAELKASLPDYELGTISGVGTKATWDGQTGQLTVFEGTYMLLISVMQPTKSEEEKLAFCKQIAEAVLKKL
ncbi:hypothetical protein [Desulfopila sp. IMCC35008]|uniref:hypothetical protein n=1 Tax=Desulfopila sp. IMCC35008 TaxID=2653858 RepID=UPI0013D78206|nr:hypothetical protein [Desulfopila sp. IMCC35008]